MTAAHHDRCRSDGLDWWCVPDCPYREEHVKNLSTRGPLTSDVADAEMADAEMEGEHDDGNRNPVA